MKQTKLIQEKEKADREIEEATFAIDPEYAAFHGYLLMYAPISEARFNAGSHSNTNTVSHNNDVSSTTSESTLSTARSISGSTVSTSESIPVSTSASVPKM